MLPHLGIRYLYFVFNKPDISIVNGTIETRGHSRSRWLGTIRSCVADIDEEDVLSKDQIKEN